MAFFFFGHFLEYFRGFRITLGKVFREARLDAAILLFGGNRHRQNFSLGQFREILHNDAFCADLERF
jgi:hypothetical protein